MKVLYFLKGPAIIFLSGYLIIQFGTLFKIRHWEDADLLLILGYFITGIAGLFAVIKLISLKKVE